MKRLLMLCLLTPFFTLGQDSFKPYNNYDFIPGDKIIFEDDFRSDVDGEFPAHWKLTGGQAVVNKKEEEYVLAITKFYTQLSPNIKPPAGSKTKSYLPNEFTVEFDLWHDAGYDSNPGINFALYNGTEQVVTITPEHSSITVYFPGGKLSGDMPKEYAAEQYHNRWHHIAIAVKDKQMKVYLNQYRVLVIPDLNTGFTSLAMGGDYSEGMPILFKNFRLAAGGGMNMLGKKFTDTKIITHGINFDYNKATIKPESMGTLNGIVKILTENPELGFEIGGHTDSDGEDSYNLKLSQQRAEAVKQQLVKMGIDGSRLTTKGYGETIPLAPNTTPEGKANNRRVEFTKLIK